MHVDSCDKAAFSALFVLGLVWAGEVFALDIQIASISSPSSIVEGAAKKIGKSLQDGKRVSYWALSKQLTSKLLDLKGSLGSGTLATPVNLTLTLTTKPVLSPGATSIDQEMIFKASKRLEEAKPNIVELVLKRKNNRESSLFVVYKFNF
jgi:hypothetical protein